MSFYRGIVATPVTSAPNIYPVVIDHYPELYHFDDVTGDWGQELSNLGLNGWWALRLCGDDESGAPEAWERLVEDERYPLLSPPVEREECPD